MTYPVNGTIPGPNDLLSQSQGQIQTNFSNIKGWSSVDHIQYGAINDGTHSKVTMVTPQAAPAPAGTTGVVTTQTSSGKSELYYTNTTSNVQVTNTSLVASSGQSMIPGGMQIRTGSASITMNNTNQSVTISPAFPNNILFATAVPDSADITHVIQFILGSSNASTAVFKGAGGIGPFTIRWMAIGY